MKVLFVPVAGLLFAWAFSACNSSDGPKTFCDTTCNSDTIRFKLQHPDNPFVYISQTNCQPDSIAWGHDLMLNNRKMKLSDITQEDVKLNKNFVRFYIKDTSYAWVVFNECVSGQGYVVKIPFSKDANMFRKNSAFNSFDPKYAVDEKLIAWTDRGNIFIEDMETGKKDMMTFGAVTELDYNAMHETVDSVKVTPTHVYVKVKIDGKWVDRNKDIVLK